MSKSKTVTLPPWVLRQNAILVLSQMKKERKLPPRSFDLKKVKGTTPEKSDDAFTAEFKRRLHTLCLESYQHSLTPSSELAGANPSPIRKKIDESPVLGEKGSALGGFSDAKLRAEDHMLLNQAIGKLTRIFMDLKVGSFGDKDNAYTYLSGYTYKEVYGSAPTQEELDAHNARAAVLRTHRRLVGIMLISLLEKLYSIEPQALREMLGALGIPATGGEQLREFMLGVPNSKELLARLRSPEKGRQLDRQMKQAMDTLLTMLDLGRQVPAQVRNFNPTKL